VEGGDDLDVVLRHSIVDAVWVFAESDAADIIEPLGVTMRCHTNLAVYLQDFCGKAVAKAKSLAFLPVEGLIELDFCLRFEDDR
jgi:hypothetical protein